VADFTPAVNQTLPFFGGKLNVQLTEKPAYCQAKSAGAESTCQFSSSCACTRGTDNWHASWFTTVPGWNLLAENRHILAGNSNWQDKVCCRLLGLHMHIGGNIVYLVHADEAR